MPNPIPSDVSLVIADRDQRLCVRCGASRSLHRHHRRGRRVHDAHTHCACNLILLCSVCHAWVHANPRRATEFGYILSRYVTKPFVHRMLHVRWQWISLFCDGTFTLEEA